VLTLDPNVMLASLLPGGIGFVLFRYGRSMDRAPHILAGLVLMIFPMFVPTVWLMLLITALLCLLLFVAVRAFHL
jgi:hypothetical protein